MNYKNTLFIMVNESVHSSTSEPKNYLLFAGNKKFNFVIWHFKLGNQIASQSIFNLRGLYSCFHFIWFTILCFSMFLQCELLLSFHKKRNLFWERGLYCGPFSWPSALSSLIVYTCTCTNISIQELFDIY